MPFSRLKNVALCLLVGACATNAEKELASNQSLFAEGVKEVTGCRAHVASTAQYADLLERIPDARGAPPTLQNLTDTTKASYRQAQTLSAFSSDMQACRQLAVTRLGSIMPGLSQILANNDARVDSAYVALIKNQISFGELNQFLVQNNLAFQKEQTEVAQSYINGLQARHMAELERRRAIADVLAGAAQNMQRASQEQQMINALNRPRQTTCENYGSTINCNTN